MAENCKSTWHASHYADPHYDKLFYDNLIYIMHLLGRKSTFFIVCSIIRVHNTAYYIIKYYDFWGTHIKPAWTL